MEQKTYEVELHLYPQTYTVTATTEAEAVEKAKELFANKNNGASIYTVESITQV